jgi:hypothetical protein
MKRNAKNDVEFQVASVLAIAGLDALSGGVDGQPQLHAQRPFLSLLSTLLLPLQRSGKQLLPEITIQTNSYKFQTGAEPVLPLLGPKGTPRLPGRLL